MKKNSPVELLRRHNLRARLGWPLGLLVAGLALTLAAGWWLHPSWARVEDPGRLAWWALGVVLTGGFAFVVLLVRRQSLLRSAQSLDDRLSAKSRLETAAALRTDQGPLAKAQREETSEFLESAPARPRAGLVFIFGALAGLLLLAHLVTLTAWLRPWAEWNRPAESPKPPAAVPEASIKWKSPEAETKAAPIEEVPLEAVAKSAGGLRDAVLEMEVNGEPRLSAPIDSAVLASPGAHPIRTSIYLDQLEVQPFDMVSYFIRAQRIGAESSAPAVSPVQFVQIKPFRDDTRELPGGDGITRFGLISALKAAQLRLMKENFLLAHTELSHDSPAWKKENERVTAEQATLEKKTQEVMDTLIADGAPAEVVNLLTQAKSSMAEAAQKLLDPGNRAALAPQGKALAKITEIEKLLVKVIARDGRARGPRSVSDPFRNRQNLELKQRFKTQAGELELLAREQKRLAGDLLHPESILPPAAPVNAKPDPSKIEGSLAERQTQISQRVGALVNGQIFLQEVLDHLEKGRGFARESLRQIDAQEPAAAREPAEAAARELALAVEAMNRIAEDEARDQLAQALRDLNRAAGEMRNAPQQATGTEAQKRAEEAAERARRAAEELAEAARKQQETGSQDAARRLNELARALSQEDLQKALDALRENPQDAAAAQAAAGRLEQLAEQAGRQRNPEGLSPTQIAQLAGRMERMRANLQRLAERRESGPGGENRRSQEQSPAPGESPGQGRSPEGQRPGNGEGREQNRSPGQEPGQAPGQNQGQSPEGQASGQSPGKNDDQAQAGNSPGQEPAPGNGASFAETETSGAGEGLSNMQDGGSSTAESDVPPEQRTTTDRAERNTPTLREAPIVKGTPDQPLGSARSETLRPEPYDPGPREQFVRQLIDDLHESLADAAAVVPNAPQLAEIRQSLRNLPDSTIYLPDLSAFAVQINPPLEGLIDMLRLEARKGVRKHQLADQDPELAPPAYRAAVSDYFEQLSRDYEKSEETEP